MKANELLRKSGIMRSGAVAGTYKNAKDRPTELMMDDVYNAKKDLVTDNEPKPDEPTPPKGQEPPKTKEDAPKPSGDNSNKKWLKLIIIILGVIFGLFILIAIFAAPSADKVFKDSLEEMLQVESVAVKQEFKGGGSGTSAIDLQSTNYIEMSPDVKKLKAQGKFTLDIVNEGVPIKAEAEYIALDGDTYIKFSELTSSNANIAQSFGQVSSRINDKWIKARDADNFSSFGGVATEALTSLTPLPYANLSDEDRQAVLEILQAEDAFTIVESAKVEVNGVDAYRYELEFNEDKQDEAAKKIQEATGYFDAGDGSGDGKVEKLELWIDISTKRFIKMEYSGTSPELGQIEGTISYEAYNEQIDIQKPDEYFIESELIQ